MTRIAVNGVRLNVEVAGAGPALLLLHGFTGSGATWIPHLDAWRGFTTLAVDLLGHGASDSPPDPERYRLERCVDDLLALMDRLGVRRAALLGYSMGGRVALRLALRAPERLWALVLESTSPGIEDAEERRARRKSDALLTELIEREGVEAFVDRWEALPLFATQARLPASIRQGLRRQRLANSPQGLANSLRGMGAGAEEPVLDRLGEVHVPTLLIAGALDEKYSRLARRMSRAIPRARLEIVSEAGHAVHLEQPDVFAGIVKRFLEGCLRREPRKEDVTCR